MNAAYIAVDAESCFEKQHHFGMFGSDRSPLKRSLECLTCSAAMGRTAIVAYGDETKSFGQWRQMRPHYEELPLEEAMD